MNTLGCRVWHQRADSRQRGLTLMELLITIVVAGVAFAALVPVVVQALQTGEADRARALALSVAQDRLEKVRELGYEELTQSNLESDTFHFGLFGPTSDGPDGTTDRTFTVAYSVQEVPVSSTDTRIAYKLVTVSVDWIGPPYPHKTVSLSTSVYRQSAGPRIIDARLDPMDLNPTDQSEIISTPIRVSYYVDEADLPLMEPKIIGVAPNQHTIQGRVEITVTPGQTFVVPYGSPSVIGPQPAGTVGRTGNEFYVYWSPSGGVAGAGDGYYEFSARAFSALGYVGVASDLIGSMKVETGPPAPVTALDGSGFGTSGLDNGVVNLLWQKASTVTDLKEYVVYRSEDGGITWTLIAGQPGTNTGTQDTGLTTGSTYRYKVVTVDWVDKESVGNPEIDVTVLDAAAAPEAPPTELRADLNVTSVTLTWQESTSAGVVGYHAYVSDGSAAPTLIGSVAAGQAMTTAYAQGAGKTLYYTVKAYRASSPDSAAATVFAGYPTGLVGGETWARVVTPTLVSYDISATINSIPPQYASVRDVELWYLGPSGANPAVQVGGTQVTTAMVPPFSVTSTDWEGQPAGAYQFRWLDVKGNGNADAKSQNFTCSGALAPNTPNPVSIP